jgi:hypothetical protein
MGIPTRLDGDLAELSNDADLILLKCKIMRRSPRAEHPRLRAELRILLQKFIERAMQFADDVANVQ